MSCAKSPSETLQVSDELRRRVADRPTCARVLAKIYNTFTEASTRPI